MKKPTLMYTAPDGGTIHAYDIEGGKRTFHKFLACYSGSCEFYNTFEDARSTHCNRLPA